MFGYFKDIEPYHERLDRETDKLKTFKNARKYSFISNLVGGKAQYEENLKKIKTLEADLDSLVNSQSENTSREDIEKNKIVSNLRSAKLELESKLQRLKRKSNLLDISIEFGLMPTQADLDSLLEYFPETNVKKIYEVEKYHKKMAEILSEEFEMEKKSVDNDIATITNSIKEITEKMNKLNITNSFSKDFLDRHSELERNIQALKEQNEAFVEESLLKDSKKDASERLEKNLEKVLTEITHELNSKMHEFNDSIYSETRNSPKINLKSYNSYEFFTPSDTGTGTNFRGMILFDLSVLYLSHLSTLAHDSLLFKNIDDEGVDGIMKLYDDVINLHKQVFIAFDKQASYSKKTYKILQKNLVLQLGDNGNELYGESWNREVKDETKA